MEKWKDVIGYEGYYQVSNLGRIKSLERTVSFKKGFSKRKERILKQRINTGGYNSVTLYKNHIRTHHRVHRIVANNFIQNPNNKPQVNHINGIKTDNRVKNLEWCTASENMKHATNMGLVKTDYFIGEKSTTSKLTEKQVSEIRNKYKHGGVTQTKIAIEYGVCVATINLVVSRKTWKHI